MLIAPSERSVCSVDASYVLARRVTVWHDMAVLRVFVFGTASWGASSPRG